MVTFDNFRAISLATALEHHSANQFLRAAANLNFVQPKLFQASRQDDHRFSDCARYPSFKFDDAGAAFRILGGECRPFYPRSPCSQTSRTASTCFDDLAA